MEGKYKEALVSQAKLYDEKTALVYQVETLKDQLEDSQQTVYQMKQSAQRQQSVSNISLCVGVACIIIIIIL